MKVRRVRFARAYFAPARFVAARFAPAYFPPAIPAAFLISLLVACGAYPAWAQVDDSFGMGAPEGTESAAPASSPAPVVPSAAPAQPAAHAPVATPAQSPWPEGYSLGEGAYGPYGDHVPDQIFVPAPYTTGMPNYAGAPPSYVLDPNVAQAYSPYPAQPPYAPPQQYAAATQYVPPPQPAPQYAPQPQYAPAPSYAAPAPAPVPMAAAMPAESQSEPPPAARRRGETQVAALAEDDPANARDPLLGVIAEMRAGILYHDAGVFGGHKEKGEDIDFETRFTSPDWLSIIGSPRPLVGVHVNDAGYTSQLFGGIAWEWWFLKSFYIDFSFGLAAHDGYIDTEKLHRKSLGSRVLFREALELGWNFWGRNDINVMLDHVSHGNLFGKRNEGLDTFGVRYGYRF